MAVGTPFPSGGFHPGAKVLAVLVLAAAVTAVRGPVGLAATGALVATTALRVPGAFGAFWALVRRLRWVFLFIVLLHGWFTPGRTAFPAAGRWSPTTAGLAQGIELVAVVAVMAAMVGILVRATPAARLAAGVAWVLAPLGRLGLPVARFGRLLAWTVDRVEPVQREASRVRDALRLRSRPGGGLQARLQLEAWTARVVLRRAREAADRNAEAVYLRGAGQVPVLGPPGRADLGLAGGAVLWAGLMVWVGAE